MNKQFKNRHFLQKCKRLIRVSLLSFYAVVAFNTNSSIAAPTGKLEDWQFSPEGSQLEFSLSAPSIPQYSYLSQPPRIVVDLPDTKLGYVPTQQNYNGAIQRIRVSQFNENVTRIVMDLAPGVFFDRDRIQLQPVSRQNSTVWVFRPLIAGNGNFVQPAYPSVGGELPPGAYSQQQPPNNFFYSPQPPGIIPTPQTPGNLPPGAMYNPSPFPPGASTPTSFSTPLTLPPGASTPTSFSTPLTLPPGASTPSSFSTPLTLPPGASTPSSFSAPLTLPPVSNGNNGNIGQPTVSVPPITYSNPSPQIQNTILPPATFPSQSGNFNSPRSFFLAPPSDLPTTSTLNNSINSTDSRVIQFPQPFPTPNQ